MRGACFGKEDFIPPNIHNAVSERHVDSRLLAVDRGRSQNRSTLAGRRVRGVQFRMPAFIIAEKEAVTSFTA